MTPSSQDEQCSAATVPLSCPYFPRQSKWEIVCPPWQIVQDLTNIGPGRTWSSKSFAKEAQKTTAYRTMPIYAKAQWQEGEMAASHSSKQDIMCYFDCVRGHLTPVKGRIE